MRKILRYALVALALQLIPVSIVTAQETEPATPMPNLDICGDFADPATPEAESTATNTDAGFDLAYVDMMITSHQNTIIMLLIAQDRTEHPELATFVSETLTERRAAIEALLGWRMANHGGAPWITPDQAMAIFDQAATENPGRGGVAGAREVAAEPPIEELCASTEEPFDLLLIDHLLPQIAGELLLSQSAAALTTDADLATQSEELANVLQQDLDALYAWRSLWYPDAGELHSH